MTYVYTLEDKTLAHEAIRSLLDERNPINRELPSQEQLDKTLVSFLKQNPAALTSAVNRDNVMALFREMRCKEDGTVPAYWLPTQNDVPMIMGAYRFVMNENQLENSLLTTEDLKMLCRIQNALSMRRNKDLYFQKAFTRQK